MTIEITLMAVSGLGMIALLVHKHLEMSHGVETRVIDVRAKTDPILSDLHYTAGRFLSYLTIHNLVVASNYVFVSVVKFLMDASHRVHAVSSGIVERASQKTEDLSKAGAASFYLKQIKESKEQSQQTIETTDTKGL